MMKETIAEIKDKLHRLDQTDEKALEDFARTYEKDGRSQAIAAAASARKAASRLAQERARLEEMRRYERICREEGYTLICGIDEAGRGPLAGPVVAGAVILPEECEILGLNDSKKLSPKRREELYDEVMEKALAAGASGIVVSNHGGRVLDQCPATAEVLYEIAQAVGGEMKIFVDGGIRTGTDIFKALCFGAGGVIIARPYVTAVYGGAEEGVAVYTEKLGAELIDTMKMCGAKSIADLNESFLYKPSNPFLS
jgi:hypothetical protein